mgnify:CR=1 FL=1
MTAKLFRNSMAVAVSVMALSIILFMGVLYQYFSDQMMEALGTETWLAAAGRGGWRAERIWMAWTQRTG